MPIIPETRSPVRHKWFPALIIVATAAWWLWQDANVPYRTLMHVIVLLLGALAIAGWFLRCGGGQPRTRQRIVGVAMAVMVAYFVTFRPVYNGDMGVYSWRWRFARAADQDLAPLESASGPVDWAPSSRDYPRFLGNGYWAEVGGVELETDWKQHPPQEMWRREIGGGWSAFAIAGDYAITQEQRGDNELVSCYELATGEPVWTHSDPVRFDPADVQGSLGGIGPRATPTIHGDRVLTQGGTGIVNCLDARTGEVVWSHDTATKFGAPVITWGKAGSPLVVDDMVIISVGAPSETASPNYDSSLVAFDLATGAVRWKAGRRQASYSSPVLATLAGERQIIVVNEHWLTGHRASDGKILWEHPWAYDGDGNASCPQPVPLEGDRLYLSKGYGIGCSLLSVRRDAEGEFSATPLWQPPIKKVMKTKFSNVLVRDGFVYGLDDVLLECVELETGAMKWKKRRTPVFGHGQVMLIGDTILVLSETGELALVEATPREYREFATLQALDDANVTWNNPAFAPPFLVVRNDREAACYRLQLKQ